MESRPQQLVNSVIPEQAQPVAVLQRKPISAFVICFNEEEQIEACLKSLSFCDEIIAIDSFSTDKTVEIAERMGARVIQRAWPGYRDQKAFGLTQARYEWVVNIDADERISDELRDAILGVLADDFSGKPEVQRISGYYMNRVVYFFDRWWRDGGWYPEYRLRLMRRSKATWGGIEPHEKPIVEGETAQLPGEIHHYSFRNLDEQLRQLHALSTIAAREEFQRGARTNAISLLVNPALRVVKFFVFKKGYREGMAGLVVAMMEGFYTFLKYAKLWEHQYNAKKGSGADGNSGKLD